MAVRSAWTDIKKKYKIYSTKKYNQIKRNYDTPELFEKEVYKDTYFMLICYLEKTFKIADELFSAKDKIHKNVPNNNMIIFFMVVMF